jgi:SNF2 family DNA or RNA helicase
MISSTVFQRSDLHEYQRHCIRVAKNNKQAGLFLDPGLGKTAIGLTVVRDTLAWAGPWLCIAPLRVMDTWEKERDRWSHTKNLIITRLHGRGKDDRLFSNADIYLMNYEGIGWLSDAIKTVKGQGIPFFNLLLDESQRIKAHNTKRWKTLRKLLPLFDYRLLLTGTPASNGLLGLWTQQYVLDEGEAFGHSITAYKQRFFAPVDYFGYDWQPVSGAEEKIWEEVGRRSVSLRHLDHITMPELVRNEIEVDLPEPVMSQYKELQEELFLEIDEEFVHPPNAAVAANKLRQVTQGGVYDEEGAWHVLHNTKLDALLSLIDELQGSPLLCLYQFRGELDMITKALDKKKVRCAVLNGDTTPAASSTIIDQWNNDQVPVLLAHPKTVSLGLNLQMGSAHNLCWYALTWSLDDFIQSEARIWRQGQRQTVIVHTILASSTIDRTVLGALSAKDKTQRDLLNALKLYGRENG